VGLDKLTFLAPTPEAEPASLTLAEVELAHIRRVLATQGGSVGLAAEVLGIDRSTLSRKIKKAGLRKT
jgi:transcriptional regulator with PAS, ATPase and Fis domain